MHRIDYDGYVTESGLRRFIDQLEPGTPGTILGAQWMNAVQEELANVVTAAGETVQASPSADRAAGWHQLADAIFESNAIGENAMAPNAIHTAAIADDAVTKEKISSVDLSRAVGAIGVTDTGPQDRIWSESTMGALRSETTVSTSAASQIVDNVTDARHTHSKTKPGTGGYNISTEVRPEGIKYYDDSDNTGGTWTDPLKQVVLALGNTAWVSHSYGYVRELVTKIPKTRTIINATGMIEVPAPGPAYDGNMVIFYPNPATACFSQVHFYRDSSSPYWKLTVESPMNMNSLSVTSRLLVTYVGA